VNFFSCNNKNINEFTDLYNKIENGLIGWGYLIQDGPKSMIEISKDMRFNLESYFLKTVYFITNKDKKWKFPYSWSPLLGNKLKNNKMYYKDLSQRVEIDQKSQKELYELLPKEELVVK